MLMEKFDLIVIGSGTGLDVANALANKGLQVAIIEKDRMGGTCLNKGCIPSKLLIHSADVAETIKNAALFGINVHGYTVDFEKIVRRVNGIIDPDSDGIKTAFEQIKNPKLFANECKFVGKKQVSVGDKVLTADKILIACGTRPGVPKIPGLQESGFITSDQALRLEKQPSVLTIIGGGYIAAELAHFFGALGTKINIIQRRDNLLYNEDAEVSKKFTEVFSKKYNIYTGHNPESVSKKENEYVVSSKNSKGKKIEIRSDQLLIATGRIPNSDTLDVEKTGVKVNERGYVVVDDYLETNVKGIFALGDVIGRYQFKHSANHEAQYAVHNLLNNEKMVKVDYTAMPHAVFSSPQIASVGFTEEELIRNKVDYEKSAYPYIKTAMGEALEDRDGFVKLLVEKKSRKILGCHIIGSDASTLIHEVLVAMKGHGLVDTISNTIHIHPALSEVIARASYSI